MGVEPDIDRTRWYPVASVDDLPPRHVFQGQLLGRELALWRADDGHINVWEDRCLHRGVRLSIGRNDGAELMCQYHGWRYGNRTGACTYVPAHPADAPAQTIHTRAFAATVKYGLVWSGEQVNGDPPVIHEFGDTPTQVLRALPINATPEHVQRRIGDLAFLPARHRAGEGSPAMTSAPLGNHASLGMALTSSVGDSTDIAVYFVQPADSHRSIVRPVLSVSTPGIVDVELLAYHAQLLEDLRDEIEAEAAALPIPEPFSPIFVPLAEAIETPIEIRAAPLRVQIADKYETAAGVMAFELSALTGQLPGFQAGAHIDVHLGNGLVRQYSLTNGTGDSNTYTIGVKLEPDSRGGSSYLHQTARQGDVLAISKPHNNFTLRRDSVRTLLIAGGIGITPLLSMAKTIARSGLDWELNAFAQSHDHVAFAKDLGLLGEHATVHVGLHPTATGEALADLLGTVVADSHVYICGPGPMLSAARRHAADAGWADGAIHFEYFKNTSELDDSSTFEIDLARSARTLAVGAGETILDVLRANGIVVPSSCEQGACGTCVVTVLDGVPDHQDVYLNNTERAAGERIMTCVSRAKSPRLTLDV